MSVFRLKQQLRQRYALPGRAKTGLFQPGYYARIGPCVSLLRFHG
jgi:hypothetical protein